MADKPVCEICGGIGYYRLNVPMGDPRWGKAIPCECHRAALARARATALRSRSGISDDRLRMWRFDTFDPAKAQPLPGQDAKKSREAVVAIKADCQRYADALDGWLVLEGSVGCGKTHLAYAIAAQALERGKAVYVDTAPDLLDALRAGYKAEDFDTRFAHLRDVALLVIDDLGTENQSPWAVEKLYQVINYRYTNRLALVVTTNVALGRAGSRIDERIASRLLEGSRTKGGWSRELVIPAGDYRPTAQGR